MSALRAAAPPSKSTSLITGLQQAPKEDLHRANLFRACLPGRPTQETLPVDQLAHRSCKGPTQLRYFSSPPAHAHHSTHGRHGSDSLDTTALGSTIPRASRSSRGFQLIASDLPSPSNSRGYIGDCACRSQVYRQTHILKALHQLGAELRIASTLTTSGQGGSRHDCHQAWKLLAIPGGSPALRSRDGEVEGSL